MGELLNPGCRRKLKGGKYCIYREKEGFVFVSCVSGIGDAVGMYLLLVFVEITLAVMLFWQSSVLQRRGAWRGERK